MAAGSVFKVGAGGLQRCWFGKAHPRGSLSKAYVVEEGSKDEAAHLRLTCFAIHGHGVTRRRLSMMSGCASALLSDEACSGTAPVL